jgi:hypothetical protein
MILGAVTRLGYFFRPFRRGAYRHAPSIEELHALHVMRKSWLSRATDLRRRWVRAAVEAVSR